MGILGSQSIYRWRHFERFGSSTEMECFTAVRRNTLENDDVRAVYRDIRRQMAALTALFSSPSYWSFPTPR